MSELPWVSVVIPTKNREGYLREALRSVLEQTYPELEVLIVNDGSTDGTLRFLKSLCDDRVRSLHSGDQGISMARNAAIDQAKGKYVAFLDDDDLWLPRKLEHQIDVLENDPSIGMLYARSERVGRDDTARRMQPGDQLFTTFRDLYRHGNTICTSTVVVRRSYLKTVGGFDPQLTVCEDYDLWLRIAKRYRIVAEAEVLAMYRQHGSNISSDRGRISEGIVQIIEKHGRLDSNIPRRLRIRRVAEERMAAASHYANQGLHRRAVAQYVRLLRRYPGSGLLFWWPEVEGRRVTALYRFLKPYASLGKQLLRSLQVSWR